MKYIRSINEVLGESPNVYGEFFVKLLGVRAQSHIFHWQTQSYAQHEAFGDFYEEWLAIIDVLAESIMGTITKPTIGNSQIPLVDYSEENIKIFINEAEELLKNDIRFIVDDTNEEILDIARQGLALIDKLKYLLKLN